MCKISLFFYPSLSRNQGSLQNINLIELGINNISNFSQQFAKFVRQIGLEFWSFPTQSIKYFKQDLSLNGPAKSGEIGQVTFLAFTGPEFTQQHCIWFPILSTIRSDPRAQSGVGPKIKQTSLLFQMIDSGYCMTSIVSGFRDSPSR